MVSPPRPLRTPFWGKARQTTSSSELEVKAKS
jgi:hypothetical protein